MQEKTSGNGSNGRASSSRIARSFWWSAFDKVGFQLVALMVGLLVARQLTPVDYGVIGAVALFSSLACIFVESGFSVTLIRRAFVTSRQYAAVFYFHLLVGVVLYVSLALCSGEIARFFAMPVLQKVCPILFLTIPLYALSLVPMVHLTRHLSFRLIAFSNVISAVVSGVPAVIMAYRGWGYWTLVFQQVSIVFFRMLLLWGSAMYYNYRRGCVFRAHAPYASDGSIIRALFSFSAMLLGLNVLLTVVKYVYNVVIGRWFDAETLGRYSLGFKYQQILVTTISSAASAVAYPVLARYRDAQGQFLKFLRATVGLLFAVTCPVLLGFDLVAPAFVHFVLTDKWLSILPYLHLLLLAGLFFPFHALTTQVFTAVSSRRELLLSEGVRSLLILATLVRGDSLTMLLVGFMGASALSCLFDMLLLARRVTYPWRALCADVLPSVILAGGLYVAVRWMQEMGVGQNVPYLMSVLSGACFLLVYTGVSWRGEFPLFSAWRKMRNA